MKALKNMVSIDIEKELYLPGELVFGVINFTIKEEIQMGCIRFKVKGNQKAFYQDPQDPDNEETKRFFIEKIIDYNGSCYDFKGN